MRKTNSLCILFILVCYIGCAPMPTKIWSSNPVIQNLENQYFEARLEPLKRGGQFYASFRITITNKTDQDLEIDWNKTRYIHNNSNRGGLLFDGIAPEDIKNLTIPSDIVPPGGTLLKEISPVQLVALAPLRERSVAKNDSGFSPGIIPAGENGIRLVVRQNDKEIREKMTLTIKSSEVQQ